MKGNIQNKIFDRREREIAKLFGKWRQSKQRMILFVPLYLVWAP